MTYLKSKQAFFLLAVFVLVFGAAPQTGSALAVNPGVNDTCYKNYNSGLGDRTSVPECSSEEFGLLQVANGLAAQNDPNNTVGTTQRAIVNSPTKYTGPAVVAPCYKSFLLSSWKCIWHNLVAAISSLLISATAWLLAVAGTLFNWIMYNTVILFKTSLYDKIASAITIGWSAFRDIANIVIIGIFSFIAISIILGLKEFGQKKLIARVLIIAVLINFSLLFTKLIVDASNFTALQIYSAAQLQGPDSSSQLCSGVDPTCGYAQSGIAGQFVSLMGLAGITDTYKAMLRLADNQDSGWIAFVHGLFSATLLVAAALVILYGAFLLVSRAILIIFLMITASVAFASYLIPKWSSSRYGWDAWWSSLIKTAVFAPIVMMFLWVTLNVGTALKANGGSLGDLIADPEKAVNISSLFSYIIVLGLLFVSFKLSSSFASKIAGFNFASMAAILPATLGSRLAGFALRQTAGWAGYAYQKSAAARARGIRDEAADIRLKAERHERAGNFGVADLARAEAKRKDAAAARALTRSSYGAAVADSKFNIMNTAAAKAAMAGVGVTGFAAGASSKDAKSYSERVKADAEAAEKRIRAIAVSGDDEKKVSDRVKEERQRDRRNKEEQKKSAEQIRDAVTSASQSQREEIKTTIKELTDKQALTKGDRDKAMKEMSEAVATGRAAPGQREALKTKHELEVQAEDAKIQETKDRLVALTKQKIGVTVDGKKHTASEEELNTSINKLADEIADLKPGTDASRKAVKSTVSAYKASAQESAQSTAEISGRNYYRFSRTPAQRNYIAKEVRNKFKTSAGSSSLKQVLEEIAESEGGGGAASIEAAPPSSEAGEKH